jgi:hypothetical protein
MLLKARFLSYNDAFPMLMLAMYSLIDLFFTAALLAFLGYMLASGSCWLCCLPSKASCWTKARHATAPH